jgi:hypothetical protein
MSADDIDAEVRRLLEEAGSSLVKQQDDGPLSTAPQPAAEPTVLVSQPFVDHSSPPRNTKPCYDDLGSTIRPPPVSPECRRGEYPPRDEACKGLVTPPLSFDHRSSHPPVHRAFTFAEQPPASTPGQPSPGAAAELVVVQPEVRVHAARW